MAIIQPTFDALRWLGGKSRAAGPGYMIRRAADAWAVGGVQRIRAHLLHAAASGRRERSYQAWKRQVEPTLFRQMLSQPFAEAKGPTISVLVPAYNTPPEMLRRCIGSVQAQTYPNWELILIDDHSSEPQVAELAATQAGTDDRIQFDRLPANLGIADATNAALERATGEFIALLDHDDELAPQALECIARRIVAQPDLDFIYTDEDKIDEAGRLHAPAFKPGYSPAYLLTCNYICHLAVIRTELVRSAGGLDGTMNGAQDYDLFLRVLNAINDPKHIAHVPLVLYHWRTHRSSTAGFGDAKPYAIEAGRRALEQALAKQHFNARVENGPFKLTYRIRPEMAASENRVHVYIRNRPGASRVRADQLTCELLEHPRVSGVTNVVADRLSKEWPLPRTNPRWILMMMADLYPRQADWIERLMETASLPGAGPVAPKIIDRYRSVSDAGFLYDEDRDTYGLIYAGVRGHDPGYLWSLCMPRNVSAVSGRCVLMSGSDFSAGCINAPPVVDSGVTMVDQNEIHSRSAPAAGAILQAGTDFPRFFNPNLAWIEPDYAPWRQAADWCERTGDH